MIGVIERSFLAASKDGANNRRHSHIRCAEAQPYTLRRNKDGNVGNHGDIGATTSMSRFRLRSRRVSFSEFQHLR